MCKDPAIPVKNGKLISPGLFYSFLFLNQSFPDSIPYVTEVENYLKSDNRAVFLIIAGRQVEILVYSFSQIEDVPFADISPHAMGHNAFT